MNGEIEIDSPGEGCHILIAFVSVYLASSLMTDKM
jgi:hypothetical protein